NMGYVEEQYELFQEDPDSIDPSVKAMFEEHGAPTWLFESGADSAKGEGISLQDIKKFSQTMKYIEAIRHQGHEEADIYAVGKRNGKSNLLDPATHGLSKEDLMSIPASHVWEDAPSNIHT